MKHTPRLLPHWLDWTGLALAAAAWVLVALLLMVLVPMLI